VSIFHLYWAGQACFCVPVAIFFAILRTRLELAYLVFEVGPGCLPTGILEDNQKGKLTRRESNLPHMRNRISATQAIHSEQVLCVPQRFR
jgi:hypothetical protein